MPDPALVARLAAAILHAHVTESIHSDILQGVGLDLDEGQAPSANCADFRNEALRTYEYACAVCGYGVMLGKPGAGHCVPTPVLLLAAESALSKDCLAPEENPAWATL